MAQNKSAQHFSMASTVPLQRKIAAAAVAACFGSTAWANPTGGVVVHGAANITNPTANILNINTLSPKTIINWGSFSISVGELTRFVQPSALSAVLNRVVGGDPSAILGSLQSNGRVFLLNPNGIMFGAGAQINVAGLVASTLNLSDADFLAGRMNFTNGITAGSVVNQGAINASGGPVYLVGNSVTNNGLITNPHGEVVLAAGNSVELVNPSTPNLRVEIAAPDNEARNLGTITAEAGRIGIYAGLIQQGGTLNASSAVVEGGRILLKATKNTTLDAGSQTLANGTTGGKVEIQSGDTTLASGTIEAKGSSGAGGSVQVLGNKVGLMGNATIDSSGDTGGGTVLVGGDFQGKNTEVQNAFRSFVGQDVSIKADAVTQGDGGKVIVWADDATRFYGNVSAQGGTNSGNGGFVEVSGKRWLDYAGLANTLAPNGVAGTLLLDPSNITINNAVTDPTLTTNGSFDGEPFFLSNGASASIQWSVIKNQLNFSNAIISTSRGFVGSDVGNITIAANSPDLVSTSTPGVGRTLQLLANNDIIVNGSITNTGPGSVVMYAGYNDNVGSPGVIFGVGDIVLNAPINVGGEVRLNAGKDIQQNAGGTIATGVDLRLNARNQVVLGGVTNVGGLLDIFADHVEVHGNTTVAGNIDISAGASSSIIVGSGANLHSTAGNVSLSTQHFDFSAAGSVKGNNIYLRNFFGETDIGVSPRTTNETVSAASLSKLALNDPTSGIVEIRSALFGSAIYVNEALTFDPAKVKNLNLVGDYGIFQEITAPITVNNLLAQSSYGVVRLDSATNSVGTLRGSARQEFLFKNAGNLTVSGSGISAEGGEGGTATVNITVTAGDLTVAAPIQAIGGAGSSVSGAGGGSVQLSATAGKVTVSSSVAAYGGFGGSGGNGGAASISVTAGNGITVSSGATLAGYGGNGSFSYSGAGGAASVSLNNTSSVVPVLIEGSVFAQGGYGLNGGSGSVNVTSAGGITVSNTAMIQGFGGIGSSFDYARGRVELAASGGNINQGGQITAVGGGATTGIKLSALSGAITQGHSNGLLTTSNQNGLNVEVFLEASSGIGTIAAPIRINNSAFNGFDVKLQNGGAGDIAVSFYGGAVNIDSVAGVFNTNPTGTYFIQSETYFIHSEQGGINLTAPFTPDVPLSSNQSVVFKALNGGSINIDGSYGGSILIPGTGSGNVALTALGGGTVNLTAGSVIAGSNPLLTADDMHIQGQVLSSGGGIKVMPATPGRNIELGTSGPGGSVLALDNVELNNMTFWDGTNIPSPGVMGGGLAIGDTLGGSGTLTFTGNVGSSAYLNVYGTDIAQSGGVISGPLSAEVSTGNIVLTQVGNQIDGVRGYTNGGAFSVANSVPLSLGDITTNGGNVNIQTSGSAVDFTTAAINAGSGAVTLMSGGTIGAGSAAVDIIAAAASLTAPGGIGSVAAPLSTQLGGLTVTSTGGTGEVGVSNSGNLLLNGLTFSGSTASIEASGVLTVGGSVSATAGNLSLTGQSGVTVDQLFSIGSGALTLTAGPAGDVVFGPTAAFFPGTVSALNISAGHDVTFNSGTPMSVNGSISLSAGNDILLNNSLGSTSGVTVIAGRDLIIDASAGAANLSAFSVNPAVPGQSITVGGGVILQGGAGAGQNATLASIGGQDITATYIDIRSQGTGTARIVNSSGGSQTIHTTGANINGEGIVIRADGAGIAEILNSPATTQTITVDNADYVRLVGAVGDARIQAANGDQVIVVKGAGQNRIELGESSSSGASYFFGLNQSVTAGLSGESGGINFVGGLVDSKNAYFFTSASGVSQAINSSGMITAAGGTAVGANGADAGIRHNGTGMQTINAFGIDLQGSATGAQSNGFIRSQVGQQITVDAGGISLMGGGGSNAAHITQSGSTASQTITVNNGGAINLEGGSGIDAYARIQSEGVAQSIDFTSGGSLTITGGSGTSGNFARVIAVTGSQTITGSPTITVQGGSGGAIDDGNFAQIRSFAGAQTITAGNTSLLAGTSGGTNNFATIVAPSQNITVNGDLIITGGNSDTPVGSLSGGGARIGGLGGSTPSATSLTLTVNGDVLMTGGSVANAGAAIGSSYLGGLVSDITLTLNGGDLNMTGGSGSPARIGSSNTNIAGGSIDLTVGGNVNLNSGAVINTLDDVSIQAANSISQGALSGINAGSLHAVSSAGAVNLGDPASANIVGTVSGSAIGTFAFRNAGALSVGGTGVVVPGAGAVIGLDSSSGDLTVAAPVSASGLGGLINLRGTGINQTAGVITGGVSANASSGDINLNQAGNQISLISGSTNGGLFSVRNGADLQIGGISTLGGNVDVQTTGANLSFSAVGGLINAGAGTVQLVGGGVIGDGHTGVDIIAGSAALTAPGGVGTFSDPIETQIASLAVSSTGGGEIGIINAGNLLLDSLSFSGTTAAIEALGALTTGGSIGVSGNVALLGHTGLNIAHSVNAGSTGIVTLEAGVGADVVFSGSGGVNTSAGSISVTADRDIIYGGSSQVNSSSGNIVFDAGNDVVFNTQRINNGTGTIQVSAGRDYVHSSTAGHNTSSGAVSIDAGRDIAFAAGNVNTGGAAAIQLTSGRDISYGSTSKINTSSGNVTIQSVGSIDFFNTGGVNSTGGAILVQAGGSVVLAGGAQLVSSANTVGVEALGGAGVGVSLIGASTKVEGSAVTIAGVASPSASSDNVGVLINGATVRSTSGGISIGGIGGNGTSNNSGIRVSGGALVTSAANVELEGYAGSGTTDNTGVKVSGSTVQSIAGGQIVLYGAGGVGTADNNEGVRLESGSMITTGGNILIEGFGGSGGNDTVGVKLVSGSTVQSTGGGIVQLYGEGGPGVDNNHGVRLEGSALVTSAGNIEVIGFADGSGNDNTGVKLAGGTIQGTGPSNVMVYGEGSAAGVNNNEGVRIESGGSVLAASGMMQVTGFGGGSGTGNHGVKVAGSVANTGAGAFAMIGFGAPGASAVVLESGANLSSASTMTFASGFDWNGGTIGGTGSLQTPSGAVTNVTASVALAPGKAWNNAGTVNISGSGTVDLGDVTPAIFNNQVGGVVNISSGAGWSFISNPSTQSGQINNAGAINVNQNTSWEAAFNQTSDGSMNIAAGKYLSMQNGQNITGSASIGAGGTLWVSERHGVDTTFSNMTISGTGTLQVVGSGPVARMTNVSAPGVLLRLGSGGQIGIENGSVVFGGLTLDSPAFGSAFSMTDATFAQAAGNLTVPGGAAYFGDNTYVAQAGDLVVSGVVSGGSGSLTLAAAIGDLKVTGGTVSADTVSLYGNNVIVGGSSLSVPTSVTANSALMVVAASGDLQILGGSSSGASALVSSSGNLTVTASGDVALAGGSGANAWAKLSGNPDVLLAGIGGSVRLDAGIGTGSYAQIAAISANTIYLDLLGSSSGGYFVNGIEGLLYDPATSTGFIAGGSPAILGGNLIVTYDGVPLLPGSPILDFIEESLQVPTQTLIVATNQSTTPPDAEKEKDIFEEDLKKDKKKDAPVCR